MRHQGHLWAIVLAGGSGERLQSFLRSRGHRHPIKQFCAIVDEHTMVEHAWRRAELLVPRERVITVVDAAHPEIFRDQLASRTVGTVVVQPANRDTAPGTLLPLAHVLHADPDARIVLLPSDHFVDDDDRFMQHVEIGEWLVRRGLWELLLLGVDGARADVSFGWIEVDRTGRHEASCIFPIRRFWEKPPLPIARRLHEEGQLWSTMVTVASARELWRLCRLAIPGVHQRFDRILAARGTVAERDVIAQQYAGMPSASLSRDVFERSPQCMAAIPVRGVYWNDLGCPERVVETVGRIQTRTLHNGTTRCVAP